MRCLLAVALLALAATLPGQSFVDVTTTSGLTLPPRPTLQLGQGWAVGDFDRDGDLDVVFPTAPGQSIRYFRNDGGMTFSDQTTASGLGIGGLIRQVTPADVDNDGDLDVFVANNGVANQLFINDGTGSFTEEGAARGLAFASHSWGATFGDYDRDGQVDLYVSVRTSLANTPTPNRLFRNTGNGFFVDATTSSGTGETGLTLVSTWFDYDVDGWPDLFCANDKGVNHPPNAVYRNNGDGTFTEVGTTINARHGICGMGVDFVDAFNDGGVDVFCTDASPDHLFLVWGGNQYAPMQSALGVGSVPTIGWACQFLDYDNDRWQDLHVVHDVGGPNHLLTNPGAPIAALAPWPEVGVAAGVASTARQYTSVVADFDGDGRIDILNAHQAGAGGATSALVMLRNTTTGGGWLRLRTEGVTSNRDGLGARVRVSTGTTTQEQQVRSGVGYLTGSTMDLHFGLGTAGVVDRIEVIWPSGQVQVLEGVTANQVIEVREPSLRMSGPATLGTMQTLGLEVQGEGSLPYVMALALADSPGIPLPGGRTIPLVQDPLFLFSLTPGNGVLLAPFGTLTTTGHAAVPLTVPNLPAVVGHTVYSAAITLDAAWPGGIRTVVGGAPFVVQ